MERPLYIPEDIYTPQRFIPEPLEIYRLLKQHTVQRLPDQLKIPLKELRLRIRQMHTHTFSVDDISAKYVVTGNAALHYFNPTYEREFAQVMMEVCKEQGTEGVYYDIGAGEGLYSVLANKVGNTVVGFDADEESATDFFVNMLVNNPEPEEVNLNTIFLYNLALGDENKQVTFYSGGRNGWASSLEKTNPQLRKVTVPMVRLDDHIQLHKLPVPTVMKIDVEGAEGMILDGAAGLLRSSSRPNDIFIEIHEAYLPQFNSSAEIIWNKLLAYNYHPTMALERHNKYQDRQFLCHFTAC